ncbi:MAG: hypothetical protein L3J53_07165 [Proteobacteria bacterium]|nr:hypothetical protein [Pseudomonadota bacterium]
MAISAKKRQKKLEKKNKKRKLAKRLGTNTLSRKSASGYASFPIHECLVPSTLFELGIGTVIISRRTPDGDVAVSAFVVDVFCLGVKNALFNVSNEFEYENTIKPRLMDSNGGCEYENIHPTCAIKLVKGAVFYADKLGFSPHRDYKSTKGIFGNIDVSSCPVKYVYGQDGQPNYISGPNESRLQVKRIIDQLDKKCGVGNYHCLAMLDDEIF